MVARVTREKPIGDRIKPIPKPVSGTDTVTVACKIPNGLILRTFEIVEQNVAIPGGGGSRLERIARETGQRFTVRGPALPFGVAPIIPIVGGDGGASGYALTQGVPRDLWETWLEQNRDADCVLNGLIFAEDNLERAKDRLANSAKSEPVWSRSIPIISPTPSSVGLHRSGRRI